MNIIGISGGSCSGKTFISNKIREKFHNKKIEIISLDSYYKDLSHIKFSEREKNNFDQPDSFDFELLLNNLIELKKNGEVSIPKYSYKSHTRKKNKKIITKKRIVIIEGIFSLYNKNLRNEMNYKVFIDEDENIRLKRRLKRDIINRGRSKESIIKQYNNSVKKMHTKFVEPLKEFSDLILRNNDNSYNILLNVINQILANNE